MKVLLIWCMLLAGISPAFPSDYIQTTLTNLKTQGRFEELLHKSSEAMVQYADSPLYMKLPIKRGIASGCIGIHDYERALKELNELIEIRKPDSLRYYDLLAYTAMNDVFCSLNLHTLSDKAIYKAEETLNIIKRNSPDTDIRNYATHLAMAKAVRYQCEGNLSGAMKEWRKAEYGIADNADHRITWLGMGGTLYEDMGNFESSSELYERALSDSSQNPNQISIFLRYLSQEIKRENFVRTKHILELYGDKFDTISDPRMAAFYVYANAYVSYKTGEYETASRLFAISAFLADSISKVENRLKNEIIASRIDPEDYSALEKIIMDEKENSQRNMMILLLILGCLISALCLTLILRERARRMANEEERLRLKAELIYNKQTESLKNQLKDTNNELQDKSMQLEETERELNATQTALSEKTREICGISMEASRNASTLTAIRSEMRNRTVTMQERFQIIESALKETAVDSGIHESFQRNFNHINQRLFHILYQKHPSLSKSEINMAAYILLNLNSKEIAQMTNRSVRTIENIKYTLRKKLGITEPTIVYLQKLLSTNSKEI
ncbi:MAG: hypothetical protein HDS84_06085 [Bacteroidales bacterium]|nr:hypothetical protein [Bacteroidales bacterium]